MNLSDRIKKADVDFLELTKEELETVSGGYWWWVAGAVIATWDAVDGFIKGMKEAYKE